ncbi:MAG: hypothetical protein ACI8QS_000220 [Planctomycetota bacterium]|jgi:hypothetical protein
MARNPSHQNLTMFSPKLVSTVVGAAVLFLMGSPAGAVPQ